MATRFPLSWPAGWPRTKSSARRSARFHRTERVQSAGLAGNPGSTHTAKRELTISSALDRLIVEIERMGVSQLKMLVSTNVELSRSGWPLSNRRNPIDPGVAVYWTDPETRQPQCMAIDIYDSVADNIAAVAATLDAMRSIERHGGAQILKRAFQGFTALPSATTTALSPESAAGVFARRSTYTVQSILATIGVAQLAYRAAAAKAHPDAGGSTTDFQLVQEAKRVLGAHFGREL